MDLIDQLTILSYWPVVLVLVRVCEGVCVDVLTADLWKNMKDCNNCISNC